MGIKEVMALAGQTIENEVIQVRTDMVMIAEDLTQRINGVDNKVKALDAKFTAFVEEYHEDKRVQAAFNAKQETFNAKVLEILIDIQGKLAS